MFKNFMKWMLLLTVIISFSSNSWFVYWLMMELNLLMFIPIFNFKKMNNSNCMISYFVIQAFSSTLFFLASLNYSLMNCQLFEFLIMISMMIKLAMIPFHFWLTNMSEMIDFNTLFLILTIQKMIPLFILSLLSMKIMVIFAMISSIFSSLLIFNLKMMKKILIYSSISHQGWMLSLILVKSNFWVIYMMIYSMLIYKILILLKKNNLNSFSNFLEKKNFFHMKITFCMLMLSLGGMPPFMGFIMKLISIFLLMKMSKMLIMILIISSMINIFIYIRMISPNLFLNLMNFKNFKSIFFLKNFVLNINLLFSIFFINLAIM
uniref:NADH dehydrogenase subunit 2 n=1 Tax=Amblyomma hebraeum TaxID=34608 RepID=UPI002236F670|nr:NADH dehydrogenase subunit 2 [Amblyomma hebraeum]QLD96933.1 NADH dehydrogenase subunit 2 [Amblyomma hebraeum]QLD96946.1 NADH dehydrogenase subunit 2 [Amblyomma hebraeum]UYB77924.1 NADH dehydrogenase subunit 2 [Amblyomma hebraeum]